MNQKQNKELQKLKDYCEEEYNIYIPKNLFIYISIEELLQNVTGRNVKTLLEKYELI